MKSTGILVVPSGVKKQFWFRRLKVDSENSLVYIGGVNLKKCSEEIMCCFRIGLS